MCQIAYHSLLIPRLSPIPDSFALANSSLSSALYSLVNSESLDKRATMLPIKSLAVAHHHGRYSQHVQRINHWLCYNPSQAPSPMTSIFVPQPTVALSAHSYSYEEWEQKRKAIAQLYRSDQRSLKGVRFVLASKYDFRPL
jgi:hypothetical protein